MEKLNISVNMFSAETKNDQILRKQDLVMMIFTQVCSTGHNGRLSENEYN